MAKPTARITIIGLDLVGASIGMALRKDAGDYRIVGHDRDPQRTHEAKRWGSVDGTEWNLHNACENSSLVITTEPLRELRELLEQIGEDVAEGAVIFYIGDVMVPALTIAADVLPPTVHFVAGRPVLTGLGSRLEPRVDLFDEGHFCVGADAATDPQALELINNLVARLGAKPLYIDPMEHDGIASGVEQLPRLLAALLFQTNSDASGWQDSKKLAGRRFALSTDLGDSSADLAYELYANRENVLQRVSQLEEILAEWRALLKAEDTEALEKKLAAIDMGRRTWEKEAKLRDWDRVLEPAEQTDQPGLLRQMFLGDLFRRRGSRTASNDRSSQ